jgi:chromosome segregation ATPase
VTALRFLAEANLNTAALAAVADPPEDVLSPARQVLSDALAAVAKARENLERASRPAERLREQLLVANEQLAAAEADLAAVDAQHAAAVRDQARSGVEIKSGKPPPSANEEAALEHARRTVNAIRAALTECEGDVRNASSALRNAEAQLDPLLLAVVLEEFDAALLVRERELKSFVAVEDHMRGLLDAMAARGRALLEKEPEQGRAWL